MFRRTALITAAAAAALFLTPAANADPGYLLDGHLSPGRTIGLDGDTWVVGTGESFYFAVEVTNISGEKPFDTDLSVFVSVPFEVTGYSGEGWDCVDVVGGVQCSIPDAVAFAERWPLLGIEAVAGAGELQDSIDIYAESREGDVHVGVPFEVRSIG